MREKHLSGYPVATLAGGCFWCVESDFRSLEGVLFTEPGYCGGNTDNPTYDQVITGKTGHAEAVQIWYDPDRISYRDLIVWFLEHAHDPTQLDRQGVDVGTQYRSAIFYHDEEQEKIAREEVARLNKHKFGDRIVTEIVPIKEFWPAEKHHKQYYEKYEKRTGNPHIRLLHKKYRHINND